MVVIVYDGGVVTGYGHDVTGELRAAGLLPTAGRRLVLTILEGRERPVSAIEIHKQLSGRGRSVGLTTVYRTLHVLSDAGLVHAFHHNGELTYRRCRHEPHHHLVCVACGLVLERVAEVVARWLEQVRVEEDFVPDLRHDLYGVCGTCVRTTRPGRLKRSRPRPG